MTNPTQNYSTQSAPVAEDEYNHPRTTTTWQSFDEISSYARQKPALDIKSSLVKICGWFILANAAVIVSLTVLSGGVALTLFPILLFIGSVFPLFSLLFSRWLAKRAHQIQLIEIGNCNQEQLELYQLVDTLRTRAGIETMPEVGIFSAGEMNAFATGMNRNNALLAVSIELLEQMDKKSIAAVVAHEIAHIANGDMLTLTLVQSVINALVLIITLPLNIFHLLAIFNSDIGIVATWVIGLAKFIISVILIFAGNLVVKAFSRRREFAADNLAARLINSEAMIAALTHLQEEESSVNQNPALRAYSAFKISGSLSSWGDLFSTHPALSRRIEALAAFNEPAEAYHGASTLINIANKSSIDATRIIKIEGGYNELAQQLQLAQLQFNAGLLDKTAYHQKRAEILQLSDGKIPS